ncbi:MAG: prepilin peptidase, partial [Actinomycetota bacterium]
SVVAGRSKCRSCEHELAPLDLIPIVSWAMLRGRCRFCGTSIGTTSLSIELVTSAVFVACALVIDNSLVLLAHWILCTGLISLTVIDIATLRLPRSIIHVTASIGIPILFFASITGDELLRVRTSLIGALCALCAMACLYAASSGRLGDGDVRLSPLLGAFLGWWSLPAVFSGFFLAFLLGSVIGLGMIIAKRSSRSKAIPFGPFLAAGTILTVVFEIDVLT